MNKKSVVLRAPVLTQSGYGVHSRQVASWLLSRNDVDLSIIPTQWGDTPWILNEKFESGLIGKILEKCTSPKQKPDFSYQLVLPNEWDASMANKNVGMTAAVETDRCHPSWPSFCNKMDAVIFPSTHALASINNVEKIKTKTYVVPESYSEVFLSDPLKVDFGFKTPYNFLMVGQLTGNNPHNDRKNIFYTIKWLCEVFKDDPNVGVVIKTNSGRNTLIDRKIVTNLFEQLMLEARRGPYPKFYLLHGDMSDSEMCSLYKDSSVKALVNLGHGEGFGLPILEAAVTGLPIIATGWSGYTDFLTKKDYVSVNYQLEQIPNSRVDQQIFVKDARWAAPSSEDFKRKVKKFMTSNEPLQWANDLKVRIRDSHSAESINQLYNIVFEELQ